MNVQGVENFTPERLRLARERRGITQKRLAELAGVSDRMVKAYEAGQHPPSEETLERLATGLGFPRAFFEAPPLEALELDAASFRSLSKATATLKHRAVAAGTLALDLDRFITDHFELPAVDVPDLRDVSAEVAAEMIRDRWGLGQKPIAHVVRTLELHGVRVYSLSEDCDAIDAFSLWRGGIPYVFLNTRKTSERSIFDAAHELGHLVLHRHGSPQGLDAESAADTFASSFLLPEAAMRAACPKLVTVGTLAAMKPKWRASVAAIARRLHALGCISEWQYRNVNIELSRRGKKNEPSPLPRETSAVLEKTLAALEGEGLGLREIARALSVPIAELRSLSFGMHAISGGGAVEPSARRGTLKAVT